MPSNSLLFQAGFGPAISFRFNVRHHRLGTRTVPRSLFSRIRASRGGYRNGPDGRGLPPQPRGSKNDWLKETGKSRGQQDAQGVTCLYIKRNVRQFEEISYDGSIIVLGDVNPGSVLRATGDIIVLGKLGGKVHAGVAGNRKSVVLALVMEPSVIAIANEVVSGPEGSPQQHPEVAYISDSGHVSLKAAMLTRSGSSPSGPVDDPVMAHLASKHLMDVQWNVERRPASSPAKRPWSKAAMASLFTGAYIFVAGLATLISPNLVFEWLFGPKVLPAGWIRVFGTLATAFGIYYIGAARGDKLDIGARGFYEATVVGRMFIFFSFCALVASGSVPAPIIVLGIVNLVGAISMALCLRQK